VPLYTASVQYTVWRTIQFMITVVRGALANPHSGTASCFDVSVLNAHSGHPKFAAPAETTKCYDLKPHAFYGLSYRVRRVLYLPDYILQCSAKSITVIYQTRPTHSGNLLACLPQSHATTSPSAKCLQASQAHASHPVPRFASKVTPMSQVFLRASQLLKPQVLHISHHFACI